MKKKTYNINTLKTSHPALYMMAMLCMLWLHLATLTSCNNDAKEQKLIDNQIEQIFNIKNTKEFELDEEAIAFYEDQIKLYKSKETKNINALLGTLNFRLGAIYYEQGSPEQAKIYLDKAEKLLEPYEEYDHIKASIYIKIAFYYLEYKRNTAISNYYNNKSVALVLADSVKNKIEPIEKVSALTNSSETTAYYNKYKKSIEQNLIALQYVNDVEPESSRNHFGFKIYHELSKAHRNLKNPNVDSLKYFIDESKRYVSTDYLNRFHQEMIGFYHFEKDEIKKAIEYFTHTYQFDRDLIRRKDIKLYYYDYLNLLDSQLTLGSALIEVKDYQQAHFYLKASENLLNSRDDFGDDMKTFFHILATKYYLETNNFEKYKEHSKILLKLKQKNIQITSEKSFDEISALYDIQKKENQITNLSNEIENKKSRLTFSRLFLLILGLVTLLVMASVRSLYFKKKDQTILQDKQTIQLQQQLLKTQMEPHFIFNTLNTLKGLIKLNRKQESLNYLNDFSNLLRNTLEQSREDFISLGEEVNTLDSFCRLQLARYNYQFDYQISVSSNLNNYTTLIPPFLIQPFVENAILHTFRGTKERPSLTVEFERLNDHDLTVLIFDNGIHEENSLGEHKPLAGTISRERFELLTKQFKTDAGFEINSDPNHGTSIKIIIPYKLITNNT